MRPLLLAVSLLLSSVAIAGELYLPVGGRPSPTDLRIVNPSADTTLVTIELLGRGAPLPKQITLAAREAIELSDVRDDVGVLRITSPIALRVTAVSHCESCGTTTSVPLLGHPVEEGQLAAPVPTNDLGWQSNVVIVNPDTVAATVTFGEKTVRVAAHATRVVRSKRMSSFRAPRGVLVFGYDVNARTGARVFTVPRSEAGQKRRRAVRFTSSIPDPEPEPQTVEITPSKDNTLFQSGNGSVSNGAGIHLFIGATSTGAIRRAVVAFDLASQIPPGSRITRATLSMRVSLTVSGDHPTSLHRVNADWGQGSSNAGSSRDGIGDGSEAGDATWRHRFFPNTFWTNPGGDFDPAGDASTLAGFGTFAWETSAAMVARVQGWLDQPATNFGWLIKGDEESPRSAKRLHSREGTATNRPTLTVEFVR